ncbi:MAG: UvrD-helicase domain-containing protein [Anaerolineae bacterium]
MWPIVEQTHPSPEQRPAIEARDADIVVTAGAGAGKTRTLVARYLGLLADGLPLRSIVAITFTKKAAREMRNRVRAEMRRYIEQPALATNERSRWQEHYGALDGARIDTIHGLCTDILRAHPAEAQVDPNFEVLQEGAAALLLNQVLDRALVHAADAAELTPLFPLLGETTLRATLDQLLHKRLDAAISFTHLPADIAAYWRTTLEQRRVQALAQLLVAPEWTDAVEALQDNCASKADDLMESQRVNALAAVHTARGAPQTQGTALAALNSISLRGGSAKAWPGGKDQIDTVKAALTTLREQWRAAPFALTAGWRDQDDAIADALPRLRVLFQFACAYYETCKRERNSLDFDDLESGALALLQNNADVRARWQHEIRALLVDEFQDTNERQRELVNLLNGNAGKLFIVGDAKQSIYRFRGADVTVFRDARAGIRDRQGKLFDLRTSYRAHRELVAGLNALLKPVLGDREDPARPWVEPFSPLDHYRETPPPGFVAPHIELHLTVGSKADGGMKRAARALAARLAGLVASCQVSDAQTRQLRSLNYGDIAILCRSSTSFADYEDALEDAGIPSLTVAGRGLYHRPEIRDLLNALHAIADPTDDLALTGFLRSAVVGVSDPALYQLIHSRQAANSQASLAQWLETHARDLPGADSVNGERGGKLIQDLHALSGRRSVADVLKELLDRTDYIAALLYAGQARAARNVNKLLATAHTSQIVSIGEFLEYIIGLRDTGAREGEARATVEGAVQIMSIHAAKGLEFPIVVIGDITHSPRSRNGLLLDPTLGPLLPLKDEEDELPTMYQLGKERAADQEDAETRRLLYVAATRVQDKLLLNGCMSLTRDGAPSRLDGWGKLIAAEDCLGLAGMTIPYALDGNQSHSLVLKAGETPVHCCIYEPGIAWPSVEQPSNEQSVILPGDLYKPIPAQEQELDERTRAHEEQTAPRAWRVAPTGDRPRAPRWVVGSLVHEALAAWRFPQWAGFESWARARARERGIANDNQLKDAIAETRRLLSRFRESGLYRQMEQAGKKLHEAPFTYEMDGHIESGIIDAVYFDDNAWTIVEFKTDRIKDEANLNALLNKKDYGLQVERYRRALQRLLNANARVVLCLLDFAGKVRVIEIAPGDGAVE